MRRFLIGMAILVSVFLSTPAFSQSNATVSGLIEDATHAVLPGATVTATSIGTGIARTAVSNSAGVYNFPGVQTGTYKISAELAGFQTQTYAEVQVVPSAQVRLNFTMQIRKLEQSVEVNVRTENLLLESSSSAGVVLPEKKLTELPLVNSNVLSLIKVMGGVTMSENPIFGADDTQFAGVSASNINLQRDGLTVNDVRWTTGLNSPVYLNPEMVGEFKMVLSPVDAELGRGNGQVQIITRSGANAFHGSAVWNNQNTLLDANEWYDNKRQVTRDWRNQNEYTLSLGGPIIKNKTFFFASWDHQFSRIRQNTLNVQVPTACARKGILRYFDNWSGGNVLQVTSNGSNTQSNPGVTRTVNADGSPRTDLFNPSYVGGGTALSTLHYASVFYGLLSGYDTSTVQAQTCSDISIDSLFRPTKGGVNLTTNTLMDPNRGPDTSGYITRFMNTIVTPDFALPNNFQVGDGLNFGGMRWVRHLNGGDNIYGLGEGPNRRQINFRIDHNFSTRHRISGTYSFEKDNGEDSFPTMPKNSFGGAVLRQPQSISVNFTSTIKPTLLNEARFGLSRSESHTYDPMFNPETNFPHDSAIGNNLKEALLKLYPTSNNIPLIIGLGSPGFAIAGGLNVWGSGRGNFAATWGGHDPRWMYGDTITWTKGRHSFKLGGELNRTQSYQELTGMISFTTGMSAYPAVRGQGVISPSGYGGNAGANLAGPTYYANTTLFPGMVGSTSFGNVLSGLYNLQNLYSGTVTNIDQFRFINSPTQTAYNDISKGEDTKVVDYRQNNISIFAKDDWKVTDSFTVNLGLRYEWYGVPYLKGGMTTNLKGGPMAIFGISGRSQSNWMPAPTYDATGKFVTSYDPNRLTEMIFVGPDSPNPDQQAYNDDWNNFGPAVGFAWQLPWFGKGKTTLRGGYQLTYMPPARANFGASIYAPKVSYYASYTPNSINQYLRLDNIQTLTDAGRALFPVVPLPIATGQTTTYIQPITANPVLPITQRSQAITVFDPNLQAPYIQNLTLSLTRNISSNVTIDVRYIGTLSRKTVSSFNLNSANVWTNGLKEAFDAARYGNDSSPAAALLDKIFAGVNVAGCSGCFRVGEVSPAGGTYGGTMQTGAQHLRLWSSTAANLANGNYIGIAGTLATANYNTTYAGNVSGFDPVPVDTFGTLLRKAGAPENFIYTNPQLASATWTGNLDHANYHSLQAQLTVRPTHGFSVSGTYVWSRNLGNLGYTDVRNRALDYGVNGQNRAHQVTVNGAFELPFGPGHWLLNNSGGAVQRIVGGWQMSWIGNFATGRPFTLAAGVNTLYGNPVPNRVADFDQKSGSVYWPANATTGSYWWDPAINAPKYNNVLDPQCTSVTTLNNLRTSCTMRAIATQASLNTGNSAAYQYVFTNPLPLTKGNFQMNTLNQPAIWGVDMALSKAVRITEGKTLQFRMDATNIFNHQQPSGASSQSGVVRIRVPSAPSATLGTYVGTGEFFGSYRPMGFMDSKVNARTFQAKLRLDF